METASHLADPQKIGVFATRDIAPGDELWTVYGDISVGQLKGRVLHQVTPMSKANAEKKKKEKLTPEALETAKIAMAQRKIVLSAAANKIVTEIALSAAATLDAPTLAAALHAKTLKICTPRYNEDEDNDALVSPTTAAHDEDADTDVDPTDGEKDPPERRRSMRVRKRKKPDTETEDGEVSLEGREMMMMMMIGHDRDDVAVLDDDR